MVNLFYLWLFLLKLPKHLNKLCTALHCASQIMRHMLQISDHEFYASWRNSLEGTEMHLVLHNFKQWVIHIIYFMQLFKIIMHMIVRLLESIFLGLLGLAWFIFVIFLISYTRYWPPSIIIYDWIKNTIQEPSLGFLHLSLMTWYN